MIILVADSSVLIDLERGNLLAVALSGPDVLAAPDFLYEAEILDNGGPELLRLGLEIIELDAAEMTGSQILCNSQKAMSLADYTAFVCSQRPSAMSTATAGSRITFAPVALVSIASLHH